VVTWVRLKAGTSRIQVQSIIAIPTLSVTYFIKNVRTKVTTLWVKEMDKLIPLGREIN
jgi:hypothetical protein